MSEPRHMPDDWWPGEILVTAENVNPQLKFGFRLTDEMVNDRAMFAASVHRLRRTMWQALEMKRYQSELVESAGNIIETM